MKQDNGASANADRAATPSGPSPSVSGIAGIPSAGFTPGPWVLAGKSTINSPTRGWVASVSQHNRAANAHLIAAAPELYEALDQVLPLFDGAWNEWKGSKVHGAALAALAKARGGQA